MLRPIISTACQDSFFEGSQHKFSLKNKKFLWIIFKNLIYDLELWTIVSERPDQKSHA